MKIEKTLEGRWVIEHDNLLVVGNTLEEAIEEYGVGMFNRGLKQNK